MMGLPASLSIYLCDLPMDMRYGFDAIVRNTLRLNPLPDGLFFFSRRRDRIKILFWDRDGCAIYSKRLENGRFPMPTVIKPTSGSPVCTLAAYEMTLLLECIYLTDAKKGKWFVLKHESRLCLDLIVCAP
jgi:transposase